MNNQNQQSIAITKNASNRILNVIDSSNEKTSQFRIFVTGGGCSGFQYGFKFDPDVANDDDKIDFPDFSILVDSMSYPYLYGSTLDFVEDLSGSKFVIKNKTYYTQIYKTIWLFKLKWQKLKRLIIKL